MNIRDKEQLIEILKSRSTKVVWASCVVDGTQTTGRSYGSAFRHAKERNEGYTVVSAQITFKHNEPLILNKPTVAEDPFNPDAVSETESTPQKTCLQCGHAGNLVVYLECPSHGKFDEQK